MRAVAVALAALSVLATVNLVALNLAFEAERLGDYTSLSAKLGRRF